MKKFTWLKILSIIVVSIICIFLVCLLFFNIVYIKSKVYGRSMLPTLNSADRIFTNRYEKGDVGDVVVANISKEENWQNKEEGDYVVKTLIAKAGDKVKIEKVDDFNYELLVNDKVVERKEITISVNSYFHFKNYLKENVSNTERVVDSTIQVIDGETVVNGCVMVLEGEIFLAGDNWEVSYDCFSCGPISKDSLVGRVDIVVSKKQNIVLGAIKGLFKMWF